MNTVTQHKEVTLQYQISYNKTERGLLLMEKELTKHFKMGRSDLHKYFVRVNYNLLKNPSPFISV